MGADSLETLERLSHSSPLISNDWLIHGSRSLDLLLQCGTTLLGEVSWIRLTPDVTWDHTLPSSPLPYLLSSFLWKVLPAPRSMPSVRHVHPNPLSVSNSREPESRQISTNSQMKRNKIFTWSKPSQCLAQKGPISANDKSQSLAMVNSLPDITSHPIYIVLWPSEQIVSLKDVSLYTSWSFALFLSSRVIWATPDTTFISYANNKAVILLLPRCSFHWRNIPSQADTTAPPSHSPL